jgi:hypothetical protein
VGRNPLLVDEPTPVKPVPPLPEDPELPRLAEILDGEAMAQRLRGAGAPAVLEARPRYVRYKPGNKAIVLYDVRLPEGWTRAVVTIASRRNLAKLAHHLGVGDLAGMVRLRTAVSPPVMFLERVDALVEWFPLNHLIPGLARHPNRLSERLAASGYPMAPTSDPELLTYKPERRAVARWGALVLKAYARSADFDQAVEGLAVSAAIGGMTVPERVDAIPEDGLTLQTVVAGEWPPDDRRADLGRALAEVHGSAARSPYRLTARDHLTAAGRTCRYVSFLHPSMKPDLKRLIGRLEANLPASGPLVLSHGDFHQDQALVGPGGVALIDFDHVCMSHRSLDLATFAAHLVEGRNTSSRSARAALEQLLLGYGARPEGLDWFLAVAILRRTAIPFRLLAHDWPDRIASMVRTSMDIYPDAHR